MLALKVISWHRADITLGKLNIQSNRWPSPSRNKWAEWSLKGLSRPIFLCLYPSVSSYVSFTSLVEAENSNFHNVSFQIFPIPQSTTEDFHKLWNKVSTGIHSDIKNMLIGCFLPYSDPKHIQIHFHTYFVNKRIKTNITNCSVKKRQRRNRPSPPTCHLWGQLHSPFHARISEVKCSFVNLQPSPCLQQWLHRLKLQYKLKAYLTGKSKLVIFKVHFKYLGLKVN